MDTNELHRLAAEVDEEHRAAMRDLTDLLAAEVTDADDATRASRRSILRRLGLGGAVLGTASAAIPLLARAAAAQDTTTTVGIVPISAVPETTTTAPPRKPSTEDVAVYSFAQSLELAAVAAYGAAADTGMISAGVLPVALAFRQHHLEHAQAFAGLAGKAATGTANQSILAVFGPQIEAATSEDALLTIAFDLENAAASTYTLVLGLVTGTDGAGVVASIQPIESRHAVVLGQVLELDGTEYLIAFQTTEDAVKPADYPIISR